MLSSFQPISSYFDSSLPQIHKHLLFPKNNTFQPSINTNSSTYKIHSSSFITHSTTFILITISSYQPPQCLHPTIKNQKPQELPKFRLNRFGDESLIKPMSPPLNQYQLPTLIQTTHHNKINPTSSHFQLSLHKTPTQTIPQSSQ